MAILVLAPGVAHAQRRPDPAAVQAAQREAMAKLAFLDGVWRGEAWTSTRTGERHTITQTERVGPFLDGAVRVVEGRGYEADGSVSFNALGIISYDAGKKAYTMRSYAMGYSGDYPMTVTETGFSWEIHSGALTMNYTATIKDGIWKEIGRRAMGDGDPAQFFEMTLLRIGDSDWPAAGTVSAGN
jgi:hypothetical protein